MRRVILNFHGLGRPERSLETGEARYWVEPDLLEAALVLAERHKADVETRFTFDDGNRSDLTLGAPLLARHGQRATFFVLADRIGQPGSLSAEDLRELRAAGHEIGSHGGAHCDWRRLNEPQRRHEFLDSPRLIGDAAGAVINEAAIPFGRYDRGVIAALRAAGMRRIYSSDGGGWHEGDYPIPRTSPTDTMTAADLEAIILGRESMKVRLRRMVSRRLKAWR